MDATRRRMVGPIGAAAALALAGGSGAAVAALRLGSLRKTISWVSTLLPRTPHMLADARKAPLRNVLTRAKVLG